MKHGVFLNQLKTSCSIYESGLVIKDILKLKPRNYTLDYFEVDSDLSGFNWYPYDFYIVNWHPHTLPIKKELLDRLLGKKVAIIIEVDKDNYNPFTPEWFDAYAIIDPTKKRKGKYFPLPRPIPKAKTIQLLNKDKFVLGSFGLFSGWFSEEKRFYEIVDNANKLSMECIVRINLPIAAYTYTDITTIVNYGKMIEKRANSNVEVIISHDYMDRAKLIEWLSEHNMNCFPYYRERPGLAAVTDQAIASGRGIMTTECNTFRHLHKYINYYPKEDYLQLSKSTLDGVKKMQDDWSPEKFKLGFDSMLSEIKAI